MWLALDGQGPLHRQTYRALRGAILSGRIAPGARLPSTRGLARELDLSRNTVLMAYAQLEAEGYTRARRGSGTRAAPALPEEALHAARGAHEPRGTPRARRVRPSAWLARLARVAPRPELSWSLPRERVLFDFRYGDPAYADLPITAWCRALARRSRRATLRQLSYTSPGGAPELRRALAAYLSRSRGVVCEPEQILVSYGVQQAIDLTARVLIDPGDRVAIEEPCYAGISLALEAAGARLLPIPVDAEGIEVARLARLPRLRLVCVTPSHQFPTGALLPLARRLELLRHARERRAFVFEDDYDSEYRYVGRPVECLQGLDPAGSVLYAGSASKLLFPALRIGWLVVPDALAPRFRLAKAASDTGASSLEQLALADFIESGQLERHVRRMRVRNAVRREALLAAVRERFADEARVAGSDAGLHVLLWLPALPARRASEFRQRCRARGVGIYPVTPYYRKPPAEAGFILGYAGLPAADLGEAVARMAAVYEETLGAPAQA